MRFIFILLLNFILYGSEIKTILIIPEESKTSISTISLLLNKYNFFNAKLTLDKNSKDIDYTFFLKKDSKNYIIADKNVAKSTLKAVRELNIRLIEEIFEVKIEPTNNSTIKIFIDENFNFEKEIEYQLKTIEELFNSLNIKFKRNFEFNHLKNALNSFGILKINENIILNLDNIKESLPFFPIDNKSNFKFTNPFGRVIQKYGRLHIYIDTKLVTVIFPEYIVNEPSLKEIELLIDGEDKSVEIGSIVEVKHNFMIKEGNYRVNIIGFKPNVKFKSDESEFIVSKDEVDTNFAIDKENNSYRVEFYRNKKFLGMIIIKFNRII